MLLTSYNAQNSPQHMELLAPDVHGAEGEKPMYNRCQALVTLRDGGSDREGAQGAPRVLEMFYTFTYMCKYAKPTELNS